MNTDSAIVTQSEQKRKTKALKLVEQQAVIPTGATHQYHVHSQSGNGTKYLVISPEEFPPAGRCNCADWKWNNNSGRSPHHKCKHIIAVEVYQKASEFVLFLCKKHNISAVELGNQILWDACAGAAEPMATKLVILLHATWRLEKKQAEDARKESHDCDVSADCNGCIYEYMCTNATPPQFDRPYYDPSLDCFGETREKQLAHVATMRGIGR